MELLQDCPRCQKQLFPKLTYCKACGLPINEKTLENLARREQHEQTNAKADLGYMSAFSYPLRASGLTLLLVGTVFFTIVGMLPAGGLLGLFASGYLAAYLFKIINETARGNLEPAEWPEFNNFFDDILMPLLQVAFVHVFCFAPFLLALYFSVGQAGVLGLLQGQGGDASGMLLLSFLLLLGGLVYLPLALLSVGLNGSVLGVHPGIVLRLMTHLRGEYLIVLGVLLLSILLTGFCQKLVGGIPLLGALLAGGLGLYSTMVNAHVIGLIYYKNREKMGG
ncbi:MAG: hypothetical protein ACAI44_19655 [Candidatus Sericytochromatia bacterium]